MINVVRNYCLGLSMLAVFGAGGTALVLIMFVALPWLCNHGYAGHVLIGGFGLLFLIIPLMIGTALQSLGGNKRRWVFWL